jgi:hypothetical protein
MSPRRRLRGDDPDDALDESVVVVGIWIVRTHIAKGWKLATRVGVELGVLLVGTERADDRQGIIIAVTEDGVCRRGDLNSLDTCAGS